MTTTSGSPDEKYDFFISYYLGTGFVFASYLKEHAKDFQRNAFLDKENIDKQIKEESDEWRSQIDRAIENSENFVLIMTLGFKGRTEIKRELKKAFESKVNVLLFKKEDLDSEELKMEIDGETIDFSKKEYTAFTNECDLLAKVEETLRGKREPQIHSLFRSEAETIIDGEGLKIKQSGKQLVEIVIGSTLENDEWLQPNSQNKFLLQAFPFCNEVEVRRGFFECKRDEVFFKVRTNGIFQAVLPLNSDSDDLNLFYFDSIFYCIAQTLLFAIRIMKFYKVQGEQSVLIVLRNMGGKKVAFDQFRKDIWQWSFTDSTPRIEFNFNFHPEDEWKEIMKLLLRIYRELCVEAGCLEIKDSTIENRVCENLKYMRELWTQYNGDGVTLSRIDFHNFLS